ncbi:hypothetical protein Dvina_17595 [Dactylosporangium vinaceum]|uniref:Uncharacterized protein n=1 Tax=Dactylosporangium vinaceum TaxID=53362 RepID=A0ABV5M3D7_9ACTN|nr:hypothetical protein [Dactylosporangium vinaceum]UAB99715.1 hypothetical protein Dvina_17595 [Dactylosporangium vinaceum]
MADDRLPPLPRRVRPLAVETAERYAHRPVEANHLRPSYLRQLLTAPLNSLGSIRLDKLAAISGRATPPPSREPFPNGGSSASSPVAS